MINVHKIEVEKISFFLLNKYTVHDFVYSLFYFNFNQFALFTELYNHCILYILKE